MLLWSVVVLVVVAVVIVFAIVVGVVVVLVVIVAVAVVFVGVLLSCSLQYIVRILEETVRKPLVVPTYTFSPSAFDNTYYCTPRTPITLTTTPPITDNTNTTLAAIRSPT